MNNVYDQYYTFRIAKVEDVDKIMQYIHDEWKPDHILACDKEFFKYQYGRTEYGDEENINCMIMCDKDDKMLGMIGYVSYNNTEDAIQVSPAITSVVSRGLLPMTGVEFMKRQMKLVGERDHFSCGINHKTILPIYQKVLHHKTGMMQQYYMLNDRINKFKIAVVNEEKTSVIPFVRTKFELLPVIDFEEAAEKYNFDEQNEKMSLKSKEYIKKRFFEHPIYEYKKWIVLDEARKVVGILFGREISCNNSKVLRLVDYRGKLSHLKMLGEPLHKIMWKNSYEYIDLMVSDLSEFKLNEAGFQLLNPDDEIVIPNYFEPFVQENIKIYYQTGSDIVVFKADGDQDRPNSR